MTTTKNTNYQRFIARKEARDAARIEAMKAGRITTEDLNRMVELGQITVSRANATVKAS